MQNIDSPDGEERFPGRGSKTTFSVRGAKAGCRGSTPGLAAVLKSHDHRNFN